MNQELGPKLVACRVCGVIMVRLARDVCSKCFAAEESVFQKVRTYLRINQGASVAEVAKSVGCPVKQIEYFIRSGRLERVGVKIAHPCQICQKTIFEGIICVECKRSLKEQVGSLQNKTSDEGAGKQPSSGLDLGSKKGDSDKGHVGKRKN